MSDVSIIVCLVIQSGPTLWHHGLQHLRLPCPSLSPRVCPGSCLLSWWCHPSVSSSVASFLSMLNFSQHQGLFQWVSSSHQVAKVLELQLQHQSFQWIFRVYFLYDWSLLISLLSKGLSRTFSNTTVQKHQFLVTQLSLQSNSHPYRTTGKNIALTMLAKWCLYF